MGSMGNSIIGRLARNVKRGTQIRKLIGGITIAILISFIPILNLMVDNWLWSAIFVLVFGYIVRYISIMYISAWFMEQTGLFMSDVIDYQKINPLHIPVIVGKILNKNPILPYTKKDDETRTFRILTLEQGYTNDSKPTTTESISK